MEDKHCMNCKQLYCRTIELLEINLNCGCRIKDDIYINIANKCQDYKGD